MLGLLRKLFRRRDMLARLSRHASGRELVEAILAADVFVFAKMSGEGLDPVTFTEEELLAEIERTARELSEMNEVDPFVYQRDGAWCLPFFSSQRYVEAFIGEYSKSRNRVFGFQVLGVKGSVVASCSQGLDVVVLNDWTPDERPLTKEEMQLLQSGEMGSGPGGEIDHA